MTRTPRLADGEPFSGNMVAVLDETSPAMGAGIYYVITTAVLIDPTEITASLNALFVDTPNRVRPFHWLKEGPTAKVRMISLIIDHGVVAISRYQSVARNKQARARQLLLPAIADDLHHEQIDHLIIESGDEATNGRDKDALLDHYARRGGVPFTYDWRGKQERVLWIADAINGTIHDGFARNDRAFLDRLLEAGVLGSEPQYLP